MEQLHLSKERVLEIVSAHRKQLAALGAIRVGLLMPFNRNWGPESGEIDMALELLPAKNTFQNFMAVVDCLEKILNHEVNLLLMQPRSPYICPQVLKTAAFVAIEEVPGCMSLRQAGEPGAGEEEVYP